MSLWSSIKSVGRAIDPTNKNAPLGQTFGKGLDAVGSAFGIPPGTISGGLAMTGSANASGPKAAQPQPAPVDPLVKASVPPWLQPKSSWGTFATGTGGLYLAAAAVLGLILIMRRK
ncbi:MAG: hypothetical protein IPO09_19000 [Anaeromyxobacter sp.]|nr:hypothetical protein [Anaeromyxobacter sp.]MBL0276014.1 hypothetical protein [Anaeromyxobacter sp.]